MRRTKAFDKTLGKALSKFERSREYVERKVDAIKSTDGDAYPGFLTNQIRKVRVGLPEYRLSPSKGLRVVFLVTQSKDVIPLAAYKKGEPLQESKVLKLIKTALKEVLLEVSGK